MFLPSSRIYVLYLGTAFLLAFVGYGQMLRAQGPVGSQQPQPRPGLAFLRYVFDARIWHHRSTRQDFGYFIVNAFVYSGLISQFVISFQVATGLFYDALEVLNGRFGPLTLPLIPAQYTTVAYTLVAALVSDLAIYLTHLLLHRNALLWQFHKVHHSAESLNPLSLFRMHPLDLFITALGVSMATGFATAVVQHLAERPPEMVQVFGLNVVLFVFYLFGNNLRHSALWLSYPSWLSRILISPAQHQVHHSVDPAHFNKNLGLIFAVWDRLFGTLYIPQRYEPLQFGLDRRCPNPFRSIAELYYKPFVWATETLRTSVRDGRRRKLVCAGLIGAVCAYAAAFAAVPAPPSPLKLGPRLEDMTWTDVRAALADGYDSVIVPTGGTEQNGPFVALGKHNFIMQQTAVRIAKRVGKVLVAPVMAYVPEGAVDPPAGHMRFAGTLSLPEPVFESVLEATARSLRAHGFKHIFFVGDSGDSQSAQRRVADRLAAEWADSAVHIAQLDDYYYRSGQVSWLLREGYSRTDIGSHAGIRDTSELMFVSPAHVRFDAYDLPQGASSGANGDASEASRAYGEQLIAMKIDAAVAEIQRLQKAWGR